MVTFQALGLTDIVEIVRKTSDAAAADGRSRLI